MNNHGFWTEWRIARLGELCAQGMSSSEVACIFGNTTRNAIVSAARRYGFKLRGSLLEPKPHVPEEFKYKRGKRQSPEVKEPEPDPPPKKKKVRPVYERRTQAEYREMVAEAVRNTLKIKEPAD